MPLQSLSGLDEKEIPKKEEKNQSSPSSPKILLDNKKNIQMQKIPKDKITIIIPESLILDENWLPFQTIDDNNRASFYKKLCLRPQNLVI
ncbi:28864_t:CDS:2 [Dentiscutata erythropus]|uniref:28864_t:CDS:1 n=1 Tax=Dentiscutata erythropus TaxID=1348616 RepID=A0A9N9EQ07_9GLOM|nr:28864_t:CDS:2 [Dentiscutata erythropus]